ncbi:exocyst complex component sec3 [Acrodontium crateriforme]|uniref:Exocyst complex component sec3 n=1 Tax=Acrodontium crateriforme TaxID=150365 RepID=A0AAQ3R2R5_9PEZI|nr:exocyst complex component sec3 [Acrodontium crateriforme]
MSRPPTAPNGYRNPNDGSNPSFHATNNHQFPDPSQYQYSAPPTARFGTPPANPNTPPTAAPSPSQSAMSRAERFEDEKRRIIESCFAKLDANGQLAESYITHIRIQEDAQYPSSPPPPDSSTEAKKPRLIIIAVRSTGRVRMHKARENTNGSFSIGKTWNLEELSAIESYANHSLPPASEREAQWRQWAGNTGFTVTITKPYYWQAGTSKEKDFFIASCIKIYRKYTKGQVPELKGFDERERAQMIGAAPMQPGQRLPSGPGPQSSPGLPSSSSAMRAVSSNRGSPAPGPIPPQPPFAQDGRPSSRPESRGRQSPGPPPFPADGPRHANRMAASPGKMNGPRSPPGPRPYASQERMRSAHSREGVRPGQDFRPGTAPGPAQGPGSQRSPPVPSQQQFGTPSDRPSQQVSRNESPNISRPHSPPRQRPPQQLDDQNLDSSRPPTSNGAGLFHSTRQRWANGQHAADQNQNPTARPTSPPSAQQLPPLETIQMRPTTGDRMNSDHKAPQTATSEVSSAGLSNVDMGDAAAVGALTSFWGPEPKSSAAPETPPPQGRPEISTPPRSTRRPTIDSHRSDESHDLRPAPLSQRNKSPAAIDNASNNATPLDASTRDTPKTEDPPEVKPLSIQNKSLDRAMDQGTAPMPGAFTASPVTSPVSTPNEERTEADTQQQDDEQYRPGLGPMIKKNQTRDRFKKAAFAANAFKPRAGGAAEKIMRAKAEREAGIIPEPDGISGVVPRPQAIQATKEQPRAADDAAASKDELAVKLPVSEGPTPQDRPQSRGMPKVEVSSPSSPNKAVETPMMDGAHGVQLSDDGPSPQNLQTPAQELQQREMEEAMERERQQKQIQQQQMKVKRRSNYQNAYLDELGVDRALLEGKCLDFESLLEEFGWKNSALQPRQLSELENDLRREQGRLEAGSWLSADGNASREEKVSQVEALLDKTIQECDELEGLLTLYSVELGSLNEDIAFIEAQSQGLQVQSANQKLLHSELQGLIQTMNLGRGVMEPLRHGNLRDPSGVEEVEGSLVRLYQAMVTIDPSIRVNGRPKSRSGLDPEGGSELALMRAVREKRDIFQRESNSFCQRLMQHLDGTFTNSFNDAKSHVMRPVSTGIGVGTSQVARINKDAFVEARKNLWVYSPLILFVKELNSPAWQTIMRMYQGRAQPLYADAFVKNIASWKKAVRKPADEDQLLFTYSEKDDPTAPGGGSGGGSMSLAAARKLTVKRSHTLAKTLRHAGGGDKHASPEPRHALGAGTQISASEAFAGAMDETAPLVSQEQNFFVDLFHASSLQTRDFLDMVASIPVTSRTGTNLMERKPVEPDRDMAKRVQIAVAEIFATSFGMEISKLVDWAVSTDPLQGVGVLACLSRHAFYLQDTSQEFLLQLVEQLVAKLQTRWSKFVDEQIKAIEDTKVKIKKRKGVIGFIKVFPMFSAAVENTFSAVAGMDYEQPSDCVMEVRRSIDDAYARINRAMFDSLKAIAKEAPGTTAPSSGGHSLHPAAAARAAVGYSQDEQEDKEMINYHVLLIENMNHYVDEVDDGGKDGVLAEWRGRAMLERVEAMEAYVGRVLKRPLGKLIDFLDSAEALLTQHPTNPTSIASRPSYNRKAMRNILKNLDSNTVSKGIDQLRTRVRKHFGELEGVGSGTKQITQLVLTECERGYERTMDRTEKLVQLVYPPTEGEKNADLEFSRADVQGWFKK